MPEDLTDEDIQGLILFCVHEKILLRDMKLQMGKKYFDGSKFDNATVCRILRQAHQIKDWGISGSEIRGQK